jgi:hypothetical protein
MDMTGVIVFGTNNYSPLGLRFIHKYLRYAKDADQTLFYFFSDIDPSAYLKQHESTKVIWKKIYNNNWLEGVNNRFTEIANLNLDKNIEYIYHFDADTNISKNFSLPQINGIIANEHFGNTSWMANNKNFDRNPNSMAYVPLDTKLEQIYYHCAFWGGSPNKVKNMCRTLISWQQQDKMINYEPRVNDESYLNKYFHYNKPDYIILSKDFSLDVSCKGGIANSRHIEKDLTMRLLEDIRKAQGNWDILYGDVKNE